MGREIQDAYIVAASRSVVGKAPRGVLRTTRPDDLLAHVLKAAVAECPGLDLHEVGDVIAGCAMPEGEQGMNVARIGLLLAGFPDTVPGMTLNRFCSSGLQAVADAAARIRLGEAEVMIAAGTESMSLVPMGGNKPSFSPAIFEKDSNYAIAYGMGITAERVAEQWKVSRDDQDLFAAESHRHAVHAIDQGEFKAEIAPFEVVERQPDLTTREVNVQ
ncbi:MAG: acetyl-CoA C-acyltransferase, partial [Betaproteobacteria bacterium]|nr:acetyl-CoA C-acyltransferase [Betaproteobacteria bacterium]